MTLDFVMVFQCGMKSAGPQRKTNKWDYTEF